MGKSDATGHTRGAGTYSRSYPALARPSIDPRTARDIYGEVEAGSINDDNIGKAGEVKESGRRR